MSLAPARLFRLLIWPTTKAGKESTVPYRNSDVRTTCGCPVNANTLKQTEWTGMPTDVALLQVVLCASLLVVLSLLLARYCFNYFLISFCCIVRYLSLHDVDVPAITQKRGRIYLSWTDASICESGFVFDRKGSSFTPDYSFQSPTRCFTTHSPSSIYDDLTATPSVRLGSTQTYCVRAANEVGYAEGYRSAPACQDIVIAWEAGVSVEHVCCSDLLVCLSFVILLCDRALVCFSSCQ